MAGERKSREESLTPSPTPRILRRTKEFFVYLTVADALLVIAVLILVFRWEKLGALEIVLASAFTSASAICFAKAIRALHSGAKPPKPDEPERWDPIEP